MLKIWIVAMFMQASTVDPTVAAFKFIEQVETYEACVSKVEQMAKAMPKASFLCINYIPGGPNV